MTMKSLNMVMGGILGASMLLGTASCSDDHYDIRPAEESAANTIWQNIEANPQLDSLAMILKRVKVYRKETDKNAAQNYADLLNQAQTFTFWAPLNGTYNAKAILDELDQVDALRAEGKTDEANKMEYTIGQQFVQNHMARFNYESNQGQQDVRLLNAKLCSYNAANGLFNGVQVNPTYKSVPSSNGNIHVINGRSPFAYNVYDYFKAYSDNFSEIYATLTDSLVDTETFSPELSVEGAMNENGEMVYVDSVYLTSNTLLTSARAEVRDEDSLYVAIVPTDKCWDKAMEKVGSLFKYNTLYRTNYNKESSNVFSTDYRGLNVDSLKDYNTKMALISSMFISPGYFDQEYSRNDSAGIVNYVFNADSVRTTNGFYLYNPTPGKPNPMLQGIKPEKASNGYILPMNEYTIDPSYLYQTKLEYNLWSSDNVGYNQNSVVQGGTLVTLTEGVNRDSTSDHIVGDLGTDNMYRFFQASGQMKLYIPLRNVMSGSYRIKMVLLPNRINTAYKLFDSDGNELVDRDHNVFRASVHSDQFTTVVSGGKNTDIKVNQDSIQTVTLFDKVTFDKCYYNLPSGLESFPVLVCEFTRAQIKAMTYKDMVVGLSIAKVILEPIHE